MEDDAGGALVPAAGKLADSGEALDECSELNDWAREVIGTVSVSTSVWVCDGA